MSARSEVIRGCDDFRAWLESQGFRAAFDGLSAEGDYCNWYAYRASQIPARECECNEGKRMQIVVTPFDYRLHPAAKPSAEVSVTGEASGVWFKLKAYSLSQEELPPRLPEVEAALIAAWNAITAPARAFGEGEKG